MSDTVRLTEEFRGGLLDLTHYGYISIVDEKGKVIYSAGDPEAMVFYRSASKPVQALPVIAHHLDEKYGFTDEETVLFAGSHLGESFHVNALKSIMKKADLNPEDLIMKPTVPGSTEANEERIRQGLPKSKLYHNCSGKHAALMLTQREMGGDVKDYWKVGSVGQNEVLRTMSVLSEYPEEKVVIGIDGCGVPVFAYPMKNIATAYKNLACIDTIKDDVLQDAARRFVPRIHEYPHMMRGTGYMCSLINHDANIIAKGGANGVYGIGLKKERIGISFKIKDGTEAVWPLIIREIFRQIGYYNADTDKMLVSLNNGVTVNDNDTPVGEVKTVFTLEKHF